LGEGAVAGQGALCFSGAMRFGLGHPNEEVRRSDPQAHGSEPVSHATSEGLRAEHGVTPSRDHRIDVGPVLVNQVEAE